MEKGSAERRAILSGLKVAAPSLDSVVLGALREGRWSGLPRIGEFRVVNGVIEVSVTAQVEIPPDAATPELVGEVIQGDPLGGLDMVVDDPSLMESLPSVVVKDLPFRSLPEPQFKSLVKRMGSLSQYSDDLLIALVEGRSSGRVDEPTYNKDAQWGYEVEPGVLAQMVGGAKGEIDDWGGGESLEVKVNGGVVRGTLMVPVQWSNRGGLTIKKNLDEDPYVDVDPKVHGVSDERALEESKILADMGAKFLGEEGRLRMLPKGTPGITFVSFMDKFPMKPLPLRSMSRSELESFVRMMATA